MGLISRVSSRTYRFKTPAIFGMTQTNNLPTDELEKFATKIFRRLDDVTTKTPYISSLQNSNNDFNLKQFTKHKLQEMLEKQKSTLNNNFIVSKLPDKGEKLKSKVEAIENELKLREQQLGQDQDISLIEDNKIHGRGKVINLDGSQREIKTISFKEGKQAFKAGFHKQKQDINDLDDLFSKMGVSKKIDHPEGYLNTLGEPDF